MKSREEEYVSVVIHTKDQAICEEIETSASVCRAESIYRHQHGVQFRLPRAMWNDFRARTNGLNKTFVVVSGKMPKIDPIQALHHRIRSMIHRLGN